MAGWADKIRQKRRQESPWHYTNVRAGEWTYKEVRDCSNGNCVTEKIKEFIAVLANIENSLKRRKDALKYLVHFVGDVHQPLNPSFLFRKKSQLALFVGWRPDSLARRQSSRICKTLEY